MSFLSRAKKPPVRPPIITITGDAGSGKTSLACDIAHSLGMKAFALQTEEGISASVPHSRHPDTLGVASKYENVIYVLDELISAEHDYNCVILDSLTFLDELAVAHTISTSPNGATSIKGAHGGYGAGFSVQSGLMRAVRRKCGQLNERGITVIFISHTRAETVDNPDGTKYSRYTLSVSSDAVKHFVDDVDVVAHLKVGGYVIADKDSKKARAVESGTREIVVNATLSHRAKNRYGITDNLEYIQGQNPFADLIPYFKNFNK